MRSIWVTIVVAVQLAMTGCGGTTSYRPRAVHPEEITWSYDRGLQAHRDGALISKSSSWSGLADAVACVPQAQKMARAARSAGRSGKGLIWTGSILTVISIPAGIGLIELNESAGAGSLLGGVVVGLALLLAGRGQLNKSVPRAVDAVNFYNDHFALTLDCTEADITP